MKVRWFKNPHEHRNDWLRFGLMRLHRAGRIRYQEYALPRCIDAGFTREVADHQHRHTSVLSIEDGRRTVRCIIDSEDGFFQLTSLVKEADLYFCAGYNASFFKDKHFTPPYAWQQPHEYRFYVEKAARLIDDFGDWFASVRPFVPIGPSLTGAAPRSYLSQRLINAHHKLRGRVHDSQPWLVPYLEFEARYRRLLALRGAALQSDIVLMDTLWGWPRHRYALHRRLRNLAETHQIHARLKWHPPSAYDGGDREPLDPGLFPLESGHITDYERMLASSRLAVFATGFHWGWRNIMTLALMWGLPIHTDRLLFEPWFDMNCFNMSWNNDPEWADIEGRLSCITTDIWHRIKAHNQASFDAVLTPERVAEYVIDTALDDLKRR